MHINNTVNNSAIRWDSYGTWDQSSAGEYAIHDIERVAYLDFGGSVRNAVRGKTLGRFESRAAARVAAEAHAASQGTK